MGDIMNYADTLNYIHSLGNFGLPAGLDRITAVLKAIGNPQNNIKAVHIAGTNGKGSVSAMLSCVFKTAGFKTGLFISPYIIDFRERIQINGEYISKTDLMLYADKVRDTGIRLTEFEFITAMAFLYFSEQKCDIVILETGLGGRLDATNVISNKLAAVITKIGLDHTAILGDTIEEITKEKCGIIKDCPVITNPYQDSNALEVIKSYSDNVIVPLKSKIEITESDNGNTFIYKGKKYDLSLCGEYQIENAVTAIETIENLGFNISYNIIYGGLKNTAFPARMEIISKNPLVVLDGAHNPDGAKVLSKEIKKYKGRVTAVIGMMKDKDYEDFLKNTLCDCRMAVAVEVENMPRSLSAKELCSSANKYCECIIADSYMSAIKKAEEIACGEPIFVFGSLYLASGVRGILKEYFK